MVDIRVRFFQSPLLRIEGKVSLHVSVHFFLQVDADGSIGSDDDIRADSDIIRDIAAWIGNFSITAVIAHLVPGSLSCCGDQLAREVVCRGCRHLSPDGGGRHY